MCSRLDNLCKISHQMICRNCTCSFSWWPAVKIQKWPITILLETSCKVSWTNLLTFNMMVWIGLFRCLLPVLLAALLFLALSQGGGFWAILSDSSSPARSIKQSEIRLFFWWCQRLTQFSLPQSTPHALHLTSPSSDWLLSLITCNTTKPRDLWRADLLHNKDRMIIN